MNQYDLAERGANDGLWDWDLTTRRIFFSPRWISSLGCEAGKFGNTPEEWFDRIHPDDLQMVLQEIDAHLEGNFPQFQVQHRMLHKDGSYRWMACHGMITRDDSGRAVRVAGFHSDITAEKIVDALTGLPNRLLLLDRLARSIEISRRRSDFLFALFILDLDRPDTLASGPRSADGDLLVIAAARRLETCLRAGDTIARLACDHVVARSGGDEFIVLVDGLHEVGEAKTAAERLLKEISAPFKVNGHEVFLAASIGVALSATGYGNAEEVLRDADIALHRAKALGKSRCEVFDTALLESAQARHQLEIDLQEAITRQELAVAFQPIVSLASQKISGFEALVRWKHPVRGMVSPAEFIPAAERTGLIVPLGRWVLEEACRRLKAWKQNPQAPKDLWISVNLSSAQFRQPSLLTDIRNALLEVDLDASSLMLELTEGAVVDNPEAASSVLMQLRVMGVRIGLDDFGTGYSSLAHLRRFPLDYLKIDHSFVRNIETNHDSREIIRTISSLSHQLGLRVIAEGIENQQQLDLIRSLDCEFGQGFFFSRAVSDENAEALLRNGLTPGKEHNDPHPAGEAGTDLYAQAASAIADPKSGPDDSPAREKRRRFAGRRGPILVGMTAIILLFLGGLIARFNIVTSPPTAYTSPPALPDNVIPPAKEAAKLPAAQKSQKSLSTAVSPEPPRVAPKIPKKKAAAPTYSHPVVHDHFVGSCTGTLTVTEDSLSYHSEKAGDSFSVAYSECSYALDGDQLSIKVGSKTYNFKSATAQTNDENRSQLQEIVHSITRLHKDSPAR